MTLGLPGADEPFAVSGLDALLTTAAGNSPDHVLLCDDDGPATAQVLARRVHRLADHLRHAGLRRGERVLILAGAQTASLVALVATLRAGLDPVLAPCGIGPLELAAAAQAADAAAMIGPSHYGGRDLGDLYLSVAAVADSIRGILTHGPGLVDGAADVSAPVLDALADPTADPTADPVAGRMAEWPGAVESAAIATLAGPALAPRLVFRSQVALFADALSLVEQARIAPSRPLIALLPPCTLAGLVGGPFAAFVGASHLVLHGPFAAQRFLAHCDAKSGYHLLVPAAVASMFADGALTAGLSSIILVSRFPQPDAFVLPPALRCERPSVDLYAFGEEVVLAQRRRDGIAAPPRRIADRSASEGLGARLHRAQVEERAESSVEGWAQRADPFR